MLDTEVDDQVAIECPQLDKAHFHIHSCTGGRGTWKELDLIRLKYPRSLRGQ